MFGSLLFAAWIGVASADTACDVKAISKKVADASPVALASAYLELAACSPDEAKKQAPAVLARMVTSDAAQDALLTAIRFGAYDGVRSWLASQEPDVRSRAVQKLGAACRTQPDVGAFFLDVSTKDAARFWEERWHKGLAECRTEAVQGMLTAALTNNIVGRETRNRSGFQSLLEVYAQNLGDKALPQLKTFLESAKDEEEAVLFVSVFGLAANLGGNGGTNASVGQQVIALIQGLAPKLGPRAIARARGLFTALGDEDAANALVQHRYRDLFVDGYYRYGVTAVEDITCKSGEKRAVLHVGVYQEPGAAWPDTLQEQAQGKLEGAWSYQGAAKCKGTSTILTTITPEPLPVADVATWVENQKKQFGETYSGLKTQIIDEPALK